MQKIGVVTFDSEEPTDEEKIAWFDMLDRWVEDGVDEVAMMLMNGYVITLIHHDRATQKLLQDMAEHPEGSKWVEKSDG